MWRIFFAVFLVVACATGAVAGPIEESKSAYDRGDYALAAQLLPLAEQGDARAQFYLGAMYAQGQGVPQDFVLAHMWYNVAAAALSGDEGKLSMENRDDVASRMTGAQIGRAQEMARRCQQTKFKECD